jgi:hypothetical protein
MTDIISKEVSDKIKEVHFCILYTRFVKTEETVVILICFVFSLLFKNRSRKGDAENQNGKWTFDVNND